MSKKHFSRLALALFEAKPHFRNLAAWQRHVNEMILMCQESSRQFNAVKFLDLATNGHKETPVTHAGELLK